MSTKHILHLLSDYIDNLLDEPTRKRIEKHLFSCKSCKKKFKELQQYKKLVAQIQPHAAPEEIRTKIMAQIESRRKTQDSRPKMERGTLNIEHGTSVHASRVTRHVILASAAIIILLILTIPKQIFLPTTISSDLIAVVEHKKGKGGAATVGGIFREERREKRQEKRAKGKAESGETLSAQLLALSESADVRVQNLSRLIELADAEIISAKANNSGEAFSHIVVGMKKSSYKSFAEKYNEMGIGEAIPPKTGFSVSNKVIVNLFPVKRMFFVGDFNADGYDDLGLHFTSGRQEEEFYIALNNHIGSFYPPTKIELDMDTAYTGTNYIPTAGDFNADRYDDIILRGTDGKSNGICFIHNNRLNGDFKKGYRVMVGNSNLSFTCPNIPFTGNFNGNDYDDIGVACTGFKMRDKWVVLNNIQNGHFDHGWIINVGGLNKLFQGDYLPFAGDFNGDGLCDIGIKWLGGNKAFMYEISLNLGNEQFASPYMLIFGNGHMAWAGQYTHYFGDFNADGLCDIMTKEGDGNVLGRWYLMINDGKGGFEETYQIRFGSKEYFVSD